MFPWVYGFEWSPGYLIFLGVFYTVALVVAGAVVYALWRSFRTVQQDAAGKVMWHAAFEDLAPAERACRHAVTGELPGRVCDNGFDCRACRMHLRLLYAGGPDGSSGDPGAVEICGLRLPLDRYYHRGHTWVRQEEDGSLVVGLDELGRRLAGEPGAVETPQAGTALRVNEPAFRLRRNGVEARILSPVDGTVLGLAEGEGLIRVRPAEGFSTVHLLRGAEVKAWMQHELERLQLALSAACGAASLADGGAVPEDLGRRLGGRQYDTACGLAFLDV